MATLGLLMLQTRFPRPPGDIGHPRTFDFPVRRRVVQGATPDRVVRGRDPAQLQPFVDAARGLVAEGCSAITTSCGFLALWQRELQAALPVPVWTSALLQLRRATGVGPALRRHHHRGGVAGRGALRRASAPTRRTPVEGITPGSALHRTLLLDLPELDDADAQQQVLAAAQRLRQRHPDIDTLVLECTNLPPYAPALRKFSGLRVLDVVTLLKQRMTEIA